MKFAMLCDPNARDCVQLRGPSHPAFSPFAVAPLSAGAAGDVARLGRREEAREKDSHTGQREVKHKAGRLGRAASERSVGYGKHLGVILHPSVLPIPLSHGTHARAHATAPYGHSRGSSATRASVRHRKCRLARKRKRDARLHNAHRL